MTEGFVTAQVFGGMCGGLGRAIVEGPTEFFKIRQQLASGWAARDALSGLGARTERRRAEARWSGSRVERKPVGPGVATPPRPGRGYSVGGDLAPSFKRTTRVCRRRSKTVFVSPSRVAPRRRDHVPQHAPLLELRHLSGRREAIYEPRRLSVLVLSPRGSSEDGSRRRRGRDVDIPWRRVAGDAAAATRIFR